MRALIRRLLSDQRVRFLLVGGVNTVVGYSLFALLYFAFGRVIGYLGALYISYAIATVLAFVLHRRFTFRATDSGNVMIDFLRFVVVYVVSLAINTAALPVLVELAHLNPILAQAIVVVATTFLSYFGHKLFSFRRASALSAIPTDDAND